MRFRLDVAPVGKGRPRLGKNHVYTPSKTKVFEETVKTLTAHLSPLEGALQLEFTFVFARPKRLGVKDPSRQPRTARPDVDNLVKSICDALNGRLYLDDSQVVEVRARKFYAAVGEDPHIDVSCEPFMYQDDTGPTRAPETAARWGDKTAKIEVILAALEQGCNLTEASAHAKISRVTLNRWRKKFEGLDEEIEMASDRSEAYLLNGLKASAEAKQDWRAHAWLLERRFPDRWGPPKARVDVTQTTSEAHRRSDEMIISMIEQISKPFTREAAPPPLEYDALTVVRPSDDGEVPF